MKLWEYKPGEWVNLDQVVKVTRNATVRQELPFLSNLRTGQVTPNPSRGPTREQPTVTLHMSNKTLVPVHDPKAIEELAILLKPMLLKPGSPSSPLALGDDSQETQSP